MIGTRTVGEIAERLAAEAADARERPLGAQQVALLENYTGIKGPARKTTRRLADLARAHKVDLSGALDAFQRRLDLIDAAGAPTKDIEFSAEFGRNLEYYTGFVFEIVVPGLGPEEPGRRRRPLR